MFNEQIWPIAAILETGMSGFFNSTEICGIALSNMKGSTMQPGVNKNAAFKAIAAIQRNTISLYKLRDVLRPISTGSVLLDDSISFSMSQVLFVCIIRPIPIMHGIHHKSGNHENVPVST